MKNLILLLLRMRKRRRQRNRMARRLRRKQRQKRMFNLYITILLIFPILDDGEIVFRRSPILNRLPPRRWTPTRIYSFCRYTRPELFKEMVSLSTEQFDRLLVSLVIHIRQPRNGGNRTQRHRCSPAERLFMVLVILRHNPTMRFSQYQFGTNRQTINSELLHITRVIVHHFANVRWMTPAERTRMGRVHNLWPGVIGAIDGLPVRAPRFVRGQELYYSGKEKTHIYRNLLAVDWFGIFRFMYCGMPGSLNDQSMLLRSGLYQNTALYFTGAQFLLSDGIFCGSFILKTFNRAQVRNDPNPPERQEFNHEQRSKRVLAENSFARAKIFRIIGDKCRRRRRNFKDTFQACIYLTNFMMIDSPPRNPFRRQTDEDVLMLL